jgi:hypothetical protein
MSVFESIQREFEIFAYGERHVIEFLDGYPSDADGIRRRREMFEQLSRNVLAFLRTRFPHESERSCEIYRDLQMDPLRERIERMESAYRCYCSLLKQHVGPCLAPSGSGEAVR